MSVRRYAEGTTVRVEQTQTEIRSILAYHGAERFAMASGPEGDHIEFVLHGRRYRFSVRRPTIDGVRRFYSVSSRVPPNEKVEREWKRLWRARLLWIKATLEFAASEGRAEVATALAAHLVMDDGHTLGEAITGGRLPLLGAGEGS